MTERRTLYSMIPTREHPLEKTWVTESNVVKVISAPKNIQPVFPHKGIEIPTAILKLNNEEIDRFNLSPGNWFLVERPYVPGKTEIAPDPETLAKVAIAIRDLHELGVPHGDVQLGNIVVSEKKVDLIDIPLFKRSPEDSGHVAGAPPYIAPEIWLGETPSLESDVYAFSVLCVLALTKRFPFSADSLASWAEAHQTSPADVSKVPERFAPLVERGLSKDPSRRPPIQQFIDLFSNASSLTPILAPDFLSNENVAKQVVQNGTRKLHAPKGCGLSTCLRWSGLHAGVHGFQVVELNPSGIERPQKIENKSDDPWSMVQHIVQTLGGDPFDWSRGDRLHLFEQFTDRIVEQIDRPTLFIIDDWDQFGPDISSFFEHLSSSSRTPHLRFLFGSHTADLDAVELSRPTPHQWNAWRAKTLRSEVRDIGQGRWNQLVETHGSALTSMFVALNDELGIDDTQTETRFDTETVSALGSKWRSELERLSESCAFGRVCALSEHLVAMFLRQQKTEEAHQVLEIWSGATIASGDADQAALRDALDKVKDRWRGLESYLHVLHAGGEHADALALTATPPSDSPASAVLTWRAQLSLSSGAFDDAKEFAQLALEDPNITASDRVRALVAKHGADAIFGDDDAMEALKKLVPEFEAAKTDPVTRARSHAYRAIGLTRTGALDVATDAHLRALEEVESAGRDAELPTYLLNVGTAYHKQGRFGLAREYYARGIRLSNRATRPSTRGLLLANQANIDVSLGRHNEAKSLIDVANEIAEEHDLRTLRVMCRSISGDIDLAQMRFDDAVSVYHDALTDETLQLSHYERAELRLATSEAFLQLGNGSRALENLNIARALIEQHGLEDLEHGYGMLKARQQWSESGSLGTMAGIELFRRHLLSAQTGGDHKLVLQQAPRLIVELKAEGLTDLVDEVPRS